MNDAQVILVDKNDIQIGLAGKTAAHEKGLLHRAVSVFILNASGEWLLQKRASSKYHSGGLWSNTCCTHPLPGEPAIEAANRRLFEEMGLQCDLKELFSFTYFEKMENGLIENEFDHVFLGVTDNIPILNYTEAEDFKYLSFADLKTDIKTNSSGYTVWFRKIFQSVQDSLK